MAILLLRALRQIIFASSLSRTGEMKRYQTIALCVTLGIASVCFNFETVSSLFERSEATSLSIGYSVEKSLQPSLRRIAHRRTAVSEVAKPKQKLDFFIAGFPKCGTTTLLYSFNRHNETDIGMMEKCTIVNPMIPDGAAYRYLESALGELSSSQGVRRGVKCPSGIKNGRVLERLQKHSPGTKFILGVRHPVFYFQSYYNYRITEIHDRNLSENIPPIETLLRRNEWKGVSTDNARFELFLMQLGKANVTTDHLRQLLGRPHMAIKPNTFKVFFYSLEQMEDRNNTRSLSFRQGLQQFLGLKSVIPSFGHENLNHFVGRDAHKETVDICHERYVELRQLLVEQGGATAEWIRNYFTTSPDVVVANRDHLFELLDGWRFDPCTQRHLVDSVQRTRNVAV